MYTFLFNIIILENIESTLAKGSSKNTNNGFDSEWNNYYLLWLDSWPIGRSDDWGRKRNWKDGRRRLTGRNIEDVEDAVRARVLRSIGAVKKTLKGSALWTRDFDRCWTPSYWHCAQRSGCRGSSSCCCWRCCTSCCCISWRSSEDSLSKISFVRFDKLDFFFFFRYFFVVFPIIFKYVLFVTPLIRRTRIFCFEILKIKNYHFFPRFFSKFNRNWLLLMNYESWLHNKAWLQTFNFL